MAKANSYDSKFDNNPPKPFNLFDLLHNPGYNPNTTGYDYEDYGQDITNNDYLEDGYDWYNAINTYEDRAQGQSWGSKAGHGVSRAVHGTINNILQTPGYLIGGIAAGINELAGGDGSMDMFVNNAWINALEKEKEWFSNEAMPVYVKESVKNGNIFKNLTSVDFWATEGSDGIAFMAAAMAPGMAVKGIANASRAMKLASKGSKSSGIISKSLQSVDELTKLDNFAKSLNFASKSDMINVISATAINTMYEAGVETRGVGIAYDYKIEEKQEDLNNGQITQSEFDIFKKGKHEAMRNTFLANSALLLLPNMVMNKAVMGEAVKGSNQLNRFYKESGKQITANSAKQGLKYEGMQFAKTFGQNLVLEGFIEEGGQMAIEKKFSGESNKSWAETYLDIISSTEGQKAIALGGILGTGLYTVGRYRPKYKKNEDTGKYERTSNVKEEKKHTQNLIDAMNNSLPILDNFGTGLYKTDEEGTVQLDEGGYPIYDNKKIAEIGDNLQVTQEAHLELSKLRIQEVNGDRIAGINANVLQQTLLNTTLSPFIRAGKDGIILLKNHLETSSGIRDIQNAVNNTQSSYLSKDEVINKIIKEAELQQKDLEFYEKYGEFKNELFRERDEEIYEIFSRNIKNSYVNSKSNERALSSQLELEEFNLEQLERNHKIRYKLKDDWKNDLKKGGKEIHNQRDLINGIKEAGKTFEQNTKDILDYEKVQIKFNKDKKDVVELIKNNKFEQSITELTDEIKKATTKTKLQVLKTTDAYKDLPQKIKDVVEQHFQDQEAVINQKQQLESEKANEQSDSNFSKLITDIEKYNNAIQKIADTVQEGEEINLDPILNIDNGIPIENIGIPFIVDEIEDDSYTGSIAIIITQNDKKWVLETKDTPVEDIVKEIFETEGSINNVTQNIDLNKESIEEHDNSQSKIIKSSSMTKVMSTDIRLVNSQESTYTEIDDRLPHVTDENQLVEWERNPINKEDTPVSFEIQNSKDIPEKHPKRKDILTALLSYEMYESGGSLSKETYNHMLDYLPVKLTIDGNKNNFSFLETKPAEGSLQESFAIFTHNTLSIKTYIVEQVKKGVNISNIQSKIVHQDGGRLNLETYEQGEVENSILELSQVNNDLDKVILLMMNNEGVLENQQGNDSRITVKEGNKWSGAIFMEVNKANGDSFPLKVNRSRVSKEQAEFLYEVYKGKLIGGLTNKSLMTSLSSDVQLFIKQHLKAELELLAHKEVANIPFDKMTLGQLENFLVFTGSSNPKSELKMEKGIVRYMGKTMTVANVKDSKEEFIDWVNKNKNRNIIYKHPKNGISSKLNINNDIYKKYLLDNKVLNTNVRVGINKPMFIGFTNTYIGKLEVNTTIPKKGIKETKNIIEDIKKVVPLQEQPTEQILDGVIRSKSKKGRRVKSASQIKKELINNIESSPTIKVEDIVGESEVTNIKKKCPK